MATVKSKKSKRPAARKVAARKVAARKGVASRAATRRKAAGKSKKGESLLNLEEIKMLKLIAEGKTNNEISGEFGLSNGATAYRLAATFKKLGVKSRKGAVKKAIVKGVLPPLADMEPKGGKVRLGVVGGGRGGAAILDIFKDSPSFEVVWLSDLDDKAEGSKLARKLSIPFAKDFKKHLQKKVDVIIDVTGSGGVRKRLEGAVPESTELMGGLSARIMWELVEDRRKRLDEKELVLKGHEAIYKLGLAMESCDSLKDTGKAIVDYAMMLTGTPAASLAILDEKDEGMYMVANKGFSRSFSKEVRWKLRKGGLTGNILNQNGPLYISNLAEYPHPNPLLLREGVRSVLAAPLTVEKRLVGILYVNDFKVRTFSEEEASLFSLLTIYSAHNIERVKTLEQTRLLSITDGLTGLYNHRYMMDQLDREIERAGRHKRPLSVILFDIDHFKDYNDRFGHLEGNKVLKRIADFLMHHTRVSDTVARFGGEEFCIIMPEIDKAGAVLFGKRLVKMMASTRMPNRTVTLSGGVATYPADGDEHLTLLRRSDERLYKAKREGRNRICK